jgi:hypothetical protein
MSRLIPAAERIVRARKLIQQAREHPVPPESEGGRSNFSYIAQVKDYLRQARDMVKFISMTPSATNAMKEEVSKIYEEIEKTGREIL